jgi:hypothetical protein
LPFEQWMKGALRPALEMELNRPSSRGQWPLDRAAVGTVWDAFLQGRTSWSRPWSLFVLKQWITRNRCELEVHHGTRVRPEVSEALASELL